MPQQHHGIGSLWRRLRPARKVTKDRSVPYLHPNHKKALHYRPFSEAEGFQDGVHRVGEEGEVEAADDVLGHPRSPGRGRAHGRHDFSRSNAPEIVFGHYPGPPKTPFPVPRKSGGYIPKGIRYLPPRLTYGRSHPSEPQ